MLSYAQNFHPVEKFSNQCKIKRKKKKKNIEIERRKMKERKRTRKERERGGRFKILRRRVHS